MSRLDYDAQSLIRYFQRRAKRGAPEARRDWLYGPAHVPGGTWNADDLLDNVIRAAKDLGAGMMPQFELVYVYNRPPCWTCEPSDYVRARAAAMSILRNRAEQERLARVLPSGSALARLAGGLEASLDAGYRIVTASIPTDEPASDPVLLRIDAAGMAN